MKRWVLRILTGLLGLILVVSLGGFLWLRTSLLDTGGEMEMAALEQAVSIIRDENGVPHIYAETEHDLFFALGFTHAQDRLWQMEFNRRTAAGRLSEIIGEPTLGIDRFIRTLGVYRKAEEAFAGLDPATRAMFQAYVDGINARIDNWHGALPPEFLILGFEPEPWTPVDSLSWLKMMAWNLSGNWGSELARLGLAAKLTKQQLEEFYPPYPGDAVTPLPDLAQLYRDIPFKSGFATEEYQRPEGAGSNNWVVSGARTASGRPLLANDPHLGLNTPSIWYLAHLSLNGGNVVGGTLPSLPFVVLGRNDRIAWGFTNTGPDTQDLYIEKSAGDGQYLAPGGPRPFKIREEIIPVKNAEPVILTVRESRHGPIISDVMESVREILPDGYSLAFQWTALMPADSTANIGRSMMEARDWRDFRDAMRHFTVPQQNIVYADTDGNIGFIAPARVPVRGPENKTHGLIPAPGWDARYDWQGFIPFEELPQSLNPAEGFVATANQKIVNNDYPHFLTSVWAAPYRADTIRDRLLATDKHSVESFAAIHADTRSAMAEDILPVLLSFIDQREDEALAALNQWDRNMAADRPEPLIFMAWHRQVARLVYSDELGEDFPRFWGPKPLFIKAVLTDQNGQARWCDKVDTEPKETCGEIVTEAYDAALNGLIDQFGPNWRDWTWGGAHPIVQGHQPFGGLPVLGDLFSIKTENGGHRYSINVASASFAEGRAFEGGFGASMRAIYDLADLENSRFILPTGQSGNILSPHYSDMTPLWLDGRSIRILTDKETVLENASGQMELRPVE